MKETRVARQCKTYRCLTWWEPREDGKSWSSSQQSRTSRAKIAPLWNQGFQLLSQSKWAVVTIQQTGWFISNRCVVSQFWKLRSLRSRYQRIQCLVRTCFLTDGRLLTVTSHRGRGEGSFWGLLCKYTKSHTRRLCSHDIGPHLLTPSPWILELQRMNLRGT